MANIILKNICKSFGDDDVIKNINLEIANGEFVVFVGPSGCGKSTLLRLIAGLEDITSGELIIDDQLVNDLQPKDRGVAMVFQSYAIFPHMTVRENMGFGLTISGASKSEKKRKVTDAACILQMEHLLDRQPSQLSGGQRQRVAIGRAIVRNPKVFLFDEPLSNLDAALRMDMRMEISKLHKSLGTSMIYVTHDQVEAMTLADKIIVLRGGEVMQIGSPMDLFHKPANKFVAGFIGAPSMNFIDVEVIEVRDNMVTVQNDVLERIVVNTRGHQFKPGTQATLGVRPQHLKPTEAGKGMLHGKVTMVERLGTETIINISLRDKSKLIVTISEDITFKVDENINLTFITSLAYLFAE
jgi:multiple sugar transport system ATP-binding protein